MTTPELLADKHIDVDGRPVPAFPLLIRNADVSSILGWPAISLPAGQDGQGLPFVIDLQFLPDSDHAVLTVADACEQVWTVKSRSRSGD